MGIFGDLFDAVLTTANAPKVSLYELCKSGTPEQIEQWLRNPATFRESWMQKNDSNSRTVLMFAASSNPYATVIELLIRRGANVNAHDMYGKTPLMYAAYNPNPAISIALLRAGAQAETQDNTHGMTALMYAASVNSNPAVVETLIRSLPRGVYSTDWDGRTPLMYAARDNTNPSVIRSLLKARSDTYAKDRNGWMPITYARRRKQFPGLNDIINMLSHSI